MSETAASPPARDGDQRCRIVATAERLYREVGYLKTTVADIARELRMSPANIYRFFGAKAEITAAVTRQLMSEVETALEQIALSHGSAGERLRRMILANESMNAERYICDRKLHDMVEACFAENQPIIDQHIDRIDALLEQVIREGVAAGDFAPCDPHLAARLVHVATIRYCHPRLMLECADRPTPTSAQMMEFCLAALKAGAATERD
jgi:AcrR family transcriptional regulator